MQAKSYHFDGVITLVEDNGPLQARLAKALGLPGSSPEAADIARSKTRVREVMRKAGLTSPNVALIRSQV